MDLVGKTSVIVGKSARSDISVMGQTITQVVDGDYLGHATEFEVELLPLALAVAV